MGSPWQRDQSKEEGCHFTPGLLSITLKYGVRIFDLDSELLSFDLDLLDLDLLNPDFDFKLLSLNFEFEQL